MLTYIYITLCVTIETIQHLLFRMAGRDRRRYLLLVGLAVALYVVEQAFWYLLLKRENLGIVLPLTGASYATVALASSWCFGEKVTARRWAGIICIMVGFALVARYVEL